LDASERSADSAGFARHCSGCGADVTAARSRDRVAVAELLSAAAISRVRESNALDLVARQRKAAKNVVFPCEHNESAANSALVLHADTLNRRCVILHLRKAACTRSGQLALPRATA